MRCGTSRQSNPRRRLARVLQGMAGGVQTGGVAVRVALRPGLMSHTPPAPALLPCMSAYCRWISCYVTFRCRPAARCAAHCQLLPTAGAGALACSSSWALWHTSAPPTCCASLIGCRMRETRSRRRGEARRRRLASIASQKRHELMLVCRCGPSVSVSDSG